MAITYDFSTPVDRRLQGSAKWLDMYHKKPDLDPSVVPLSVADMEYSTAPEIKNALHKLVDEAVLGYTMPTDDFYHEVMSWQMRRHGLALEREWICTSQGVVPALYSLVECLTSADDAVIIQPPVYYPFRMAAEARKRTVLENPLIRDGLSYQINFVELEELASKPEAKMLILCSPHNPVGRIWSKEELKRVIDICVCNDVIIVSDEIHNDLIMPGYTHTSLLALASQNERDSIIVACAPSKSFNLAGVQASTIFIPNPQMREAFLEEQKSRGEGMLSAFAYAATIAAYRDSEAWLDELNEHVYTNYKVLCDSLRELDNRLQLAELMGTYLAWVDFSAWGLKALELETFMQDEAQLFLDEGYIFGSGGEGFERFNLACPTQVLRDALPRLSRAAKRCGFSQQDRG